MSNSVQYCQVPRRSSFYQVEANDRVWCFLRQLRVWVVAAKKNVKTFPKKKPLSLNYNCSSQSCFQIANPVASPIPSILTLARTFSLAIPLRNKNAQKKHCLPVRHNSTELTKLAMIFNYFSKQNPHLATKGPLWSLRRMAL